MRVSATCSNAFSHCWIQLDLLIFNMMFTKLWNWMSSWWENWAISHIKASLVLFCQYLVVCSWLRPCFVIFRSRLRYSDWLRFSNLILLPLNSIRPSMRVNNIVVMSEVNYRLWVLRYKSIYIVLCLNVRGSLPGLLLMLLPWDPDPFWLFGYYGDISRVCFNFWLNTSVIRRPFTP